MPRLIDDLRAPNARVQMPWFIAPHKGRAWEEHTAKLHEMLRDPSLPVLLIDNVADYYFTASDQENWDLTKDFPNLAPPFPQFWFEHKMPRLIHSKEKGDTAVSDLIPSGRVGGLITALTRDQMNLEGAPDNVKWVLWCELFIDFGRRGIAADGSHGLTFFAVDAEGRLVDRPWMQALADGEHNEHMRNYMIWFNPALLAISFLHCKNVKLVDNTVDKPLAKKYKQRHGVEPCAYKTLVIEPLKQILRNEGRSGEVGIAKAMHICRGHFRDYREGRGLFGKYHQLVWTPAMVRGTKGAQAPPREIEVKV